MATKEHVRRSIDALGRVAAGAGAALLTQRQAHEKCYVARHGEEPKGHKD
jgi:hypothetical protein